MIRRTACRNVRRRLLLPVLAVPAVIGAFAVTGRSASALSVGVDLPLLDTSTPVSLPPQPQPTLVNQAHASSVHHADYGSSTHNTPSSSGVAGKPAKRAVTIKYQPLQQLPLIDTSAVLDIPVPAAVSARPLPATASLPEAFAIGRILQPSGDGWRFFGVAWYWWALDGTLVWCVTRAAGRVRNRWNANRIAS